VRYTIGDLARMRLFELLAVWLDLALPGRCPREKQEVSMAAAAAPGHLATVTPMRAQGQGR